jgi:hypothetical protein
MKQNEATFLLTPPDMLTEGGKKRRVAEHVDSHGRQELISIWRRLLVRFRVCLAYVLQPRLSFSEFLNSVILLDFLI